MAAPEVVLPWVEGAPPSTVASLAARVWVFAVQVIAAFTVFTRATQAAALLSELAEAINALEADMDKAVQELKAAQAASQARTASLEGTPEPRNRDALRRVLGNLRHYFWGVEDQMAQQKRISLLAELEDKVDILSAWTPAHSDAFKTALHAVATGKWMLVYDPRKPV